MAKFVQFTQILRYQKIQLTALLVVSLMTYKSTGALLSTAQYSSYQSASCDSTRLIRCQQDVLKDMQTVSLNSASIQQPISGPPYSPKQQYQQQQHAQLQQLVITPSTCRLVRSNLDCLLVTTPSCYEQGIQTAQNTDVILRAKRFLEQNGCNQPETTWQNTFCFRSPEVRSCEERYGFTSYSGGPLLMGGNATACLAYHAFKYCVETHLRLNCKVHEIDMANEYLIDKASDLAWRCPANSSVSSAYSAQIQSGVNYANPYQLNNQPNGPLLNPSISSYSNNFAGYEQRPIPSYSGSGSPLRDQPWERFRSPLDEVRYGLSRYPNSAGGSGEIFDRIVAAGNGFDTDSSDCPVKAAPYARECEDTLLEQHRLARDSRDGNELQRRMCCSLYQYRDCISRVVLDRCADSSPTAVEVLMGVRRREMTYTCRGFNRDICSGALSNFGQLSLPFLLVLVFLSWSFVGGQRRSLNVTSRLTSN